MTEIEHIDPTGLGLLIVAAVSLPLALGNLIMDGDFSKFDVGSVATWLGALIILTGLLAYMANSSFGMTVLVLVGIAVVFSGGEYGSLGAWGAIVFGIIFLFFIYWAYALKLPKLMVLLLTTTALIFLLVGVMSIMTTNGSDIGAVRTVLGIVALFNFIFNFWLGVGLCTEGCEKGKIPYF